MQTEKPQVKRSQSSAGFHAPLRAPFCSGKLIVVLLLMLAGFGAPAEDALIIQNENLTAKWDLKLSRLTMTRKSSDQMFLSNADFSERIVVAEKNP